jgi:hypothetical protein
MRIVLNKYNINLYSTGTKNKAFFVERFNYTLGNKFKPILYDSFDWLTLLPKIVKSYNNSYHITIKMKLGEYNRNYFTLDDIANIERLLNIQIKIVAAECFNSIIYSGLEKDIKVYLYKNGNHFDTVLLL